MKLFLLLLIRMFLNICTLIIAGVVVSYFTVQLIKYEVAMTIHNALIESNKTITKGIYK